VESFLEGYKKSYPLNGINTGGAKGPDSHAHDWAIVNDYPCKIFHPDNPDRKEDYIIHNHHIVDESDSVVAFWDGQSNGTKSVIDYCKKTGKKCMVYKIGADDEVEL